MLLSKYTPFLVTMTVVGSFALAVTACAAAADGESAHPAAAAAPAEETPKALIERVCQSCHDLQVLTQPAHAAGDWPGIIERMRTNGADLTDAQTKQITEYLTKTYSAKP